MIKFHTTWKITGYKTSTKPNIEIFDAEGLTELTKQRIIEA